MNQIDEAVREIMAARPTFAAGDRVRIRLSGECQLTYVPGCLHHDQRLTGHRTSECGRVGMISRIELADSFYGRQGHVHEIERDDGVHLNYAATELEKLDP